MITILSFADEQEIFAAHGLTREGGLGEVADAEFYACANLPSTPERRAERVEALEFDLIRYVMESE